jgi:hypothetical protein
MYSHRTISDIFTGNFDHILQLHVHETNKMGNMSGFMKTIPSSPPIDGDYGVYALDCEMVMYLFFSVILYAINCSIVSKFTIVLPPCAKKQYCLMENLLYILITLKRQV